MLMVFSRHTFNLRTRANKESCHENKKNKKAAYSVTLISLFVALLTVWLSFGAPSFVESSRNKVQNVPQDIAPERQ